MTAESPSYPRRLALGGTYNVRDVGGYLTRDGCITRWRTLFRGDSLHRVDALGQQELVELGVKKVIDLREPTEVEDAPNVFAESPLVSYVNVSLVDDPTNAMPRQPSAPRTLAEAYRAILQTGAESIATIVSDLAEPNGLPAVIHCTAGKDRTGLLIALLLSMAGVPNATIAWDYELSAMYLVGSYFDEARQRAARAGIPWLQYRERLVCPASLMLDTLAWLGNEHGGARSYLVDAGAALGLLDALTGRLLER